MVKFDQTILENLVNEFQKVHIGESGYLWQYQSMEGVQSNIDDIYTIMAYLTPKNLTSILNIGTGWGAFEHIMKKNDYYVKTVEFTPCLDEELNGFLRSFFGTEIDYYSSNFNHGYEIYDCNERFDAATVSRFHSFQHELDRDKAMIFFKEVFKYTDTIIIIDLALSPSARNLFDELGASKEWAAYILTKDLL